MFFNYLLPINMSGSKTRWIILLRVIEVLFTPLDKCLFRLDKCFHPLFMAFFIYINLILVIMLTTYR